MKQGYKTTTVMAIAAILAISVIAIVDMPEVEAKKSPKHFWAKINADQEVFTGLPVNPDIWEDVKGKGIAHFKISKDGEKMRYQIIIAKITNVVGVHIHNGGHGENAHDHIVDIVATDQNNPSTGKWFKKFGVLTDADVLPNHHGHERTLEDLVQAMKDKNTYLQVHTSSNGQPDSTEPGNLYTPGEVRGNIFSGRR